MRSATTLVSRAKVAMDAVDPSLTERFVTLACFIEQAPDIAKKYRDLPDVPVDDAEYLSKLAASYADARTPSKPKRPTTVPDEMVSVILNEFFEIEKDQLSRIKLEHSLSMAAENLVGELLERYIASVMEPHGWVWCAGSVVRSVDFILPPGKGSAEWTLLQVKNRDNSENSSSSAIRNGTKIQKWFRSFSRRSETNWRAFPSKGMAHKLSESDFEAFVRTHLDELKGGANG